MPTRVTIVIDGPPRAKQRPRAGKGFIYTPRETEIEEAHVRGLGLKVMQNTSPFVGPVMLELEAVFEFPASWPDRVTSMSNVPHISRPDVDNIAKLVLDALNGVVFTDDGQVCEIRARKRYGHGARVEATFTRLETSEDHPALRRARKREREGEITPRTQRRPKKPRRAPQPRGDAPLPKRLR